MEVTSLARKKGFCGEAKGDEEGVDLLQMAKGRVLVKQREDDVTTM